MLETVRIEVDGPLIEGWRARVGEASAALDWGGSKFVARAHASGAQLALTAPVDQLYTATEVNEWALCATLIALGRADIASVEAALRHASEVNASPISVMVGIAPVVDQRAAFARMRAFAAQEQNVALRALLAVAGARALPCLLDDDALTLGLGAGGTTFSLEALPSPDEVPWPALRTIPLAAVTGSNGKTTTVRLIAAAMTAQGWVNGYSCTDGVFVGGTQVGSGDYSGPAGARRVLRDTRVQAAVLETARGGILRRGLAVSRSIARRQPW